MKHAERILPARASFTTADGLEVDVARRGRVPLVAIRLVVKCGSARDPRQRLGLADFTVRLMRRGTKRFDADALNEAVEFVGGSLAVFASEDFVALAITTQRSTSATCSKCSGKWCGAHLSARRLRYRACEDAGPVRKRLG